MFNNQFTKKDPLVDSVKKVMEQNEKERQATAAVNEKFGVVDRRALPHELHSHWDAAYQKTLSEGVEALDEISKKTLGSYIKKASGNAVKNQQDYERHYNKTGETDGDEHNDHVEKAGEADDKVSRRLKGIRKATDRLVKEETLDEVSGKLAATYLRKKRDRDYTSEDGKSFKRKKSMTLKDADRDMKSTVRALKRVERDRKVNEEQLDELSKDTLKSYVKNAKKDVDNTWNKKHFHGIDDGKHIHKREDNIKKAEKRLSGKMYIKKKYKMNEDQMEEGLKMSDYGHDKEKTKAKRIKAILKHRQGSDDGKDSVEQSRREDK
jgi:hypothetical protein